MAGRRKEVLDIREIIRRCRLGESDRQIARDLSTGRNTVAWYREWAKKEGLLDSAELPDAAYIQKRFQATIPPAPPGPGSSVAGFHDYIVAKRQAGVELVALRRLLQDEKSYKGSYSSLRRYVEKLEAGDRRETFGRVETDPGEEAQVDFGYAGMIFDKTEKRLRKGWVFVMKLGFSRHQYDEIVFDQTVGTWCALHARAFEFFGGVVERVKVDNLKAAITKVVMNDPEANRTYLELAEHYGFSISPCKPRTPRHKGKVEKGGVHYVKRNALAGRTFPGKDEANEYLAWWTMNVAGVRDHGTVHEAPLKRFNERERQALKPLPPTRYEPSIWKQVKLHPDCHVVFEYNYYSAPHRLVGQQLWLRATPEKVEIYHNHQRIATHPHAAGKGQRLTIKDHYPPEKIQGLLTTVVYVKEQATQIGPKTAQFVEALLAQKPMDRLRGAQGVVSHAQRYGAKRVEAACARALAFDNIKASAIKNILKKGLDQEPVADAIAATAPLPKTSEFARDIFDQIPRKAF